MSPRFDASPAYVDDLLGKDTQTLAVPHFQRKFAWEREQVEQFWHDISDAVARNRDEYFLGPLVLQGDSRMGRPIIDGQQRLASLTMTLAAVRNKLQAIGAGGLEKAAAAAVRLNSLILRTNLAGDVISPVLSLSQDDTMSFHRYVQTHPGEADHLDTATPITTGLKGRPPRNRIREAMRLLQQKVDEYVGPLVDDAAADKLIRLAEFLKDKVSVIAIKVDDDSDAYLVFESLNYRGLDLSIADLLKNHLFMRVKPETVPVLTTLWNGLMTTLGDQSAPRFLRAHWLSTRSHVTEKELYPEIKQELEKNNTSSNSFITELTDSASTYVAVVAPVIEDPNGSDLRDLVAMRAAQGVPFLMAAKEALTAEEFTTAVRIVETLLTRNIIAGRQNPNQLEGRFSEWALAVRTTKKIAPIVAQAKGMLLPDDQFEGAFGILEGLQTAQTRYLLRKIEFHRNKETQLVPSGVDLEHILPQSPTNEWMNAVGLDIEEAESLAQRLGNITLLQDKLNRKASTRPFIEKRDDYYSKSNIKMTQALLANDSWGTDEIEARQADLAQVSKEIWSLG